MSKRSAVSDRPGLFQRTDEGVPELKKQPESEPRSKRTYYLPDDVVLLLSELQLSRWREEGQKPELSDLVAEAIRQYAQQTSRAA